MTITEANQLAENLKPAIREAAREVLREEVGAEISALKGRVSKLERDKRRAMIGWSTLVAGCTLAVEQFWSRLSR